MNTQTSTTYNGHKNYDYWNVALWISNDEGLYNLAVSLRRRYKAEEAAKILLSSLPEKTPDGVKYTLNNLRAAIRGL